LTHVSDIRRVIYLSRFASRLARIGHVQPRRAPARAEHRHDAKVELGGALADPQLGVEIGVEAESEAATAVMDEKSYKCALLKVKNAARKTILRLFDCGAQAGVIHKILITASGRT
jgi:hypothetical protein